MSKEKDESKRKKEELSKNEKENLSGENNSAEGENKSTNDVKPERTEREIYEEKIAQLERDVQEYKDAFLRKAAEFENYKRRSESDQLNLIRYAAESLIRKLLPIVDDFERSLDHMEKPNNIDAIKEGIKLIYDKLRKVLEEQGVKKIDAIGKPFDVHFHEALMQRPAEGVEPHTVVDELEKGYMYKDRVIRHSKVVVSEEASEETLNKSEEDASDNSKGKDE